jgi:DNA polymerase-3 subunit epsilon
MSLKTDYLIFIDFEASSLDIDSWPIEIGLTIIQDGKLHTWWSLIKPEADWPERAWSWESAQIHGIPRQDLNTAPPAADVGREFLDRIGQRHIVSDAPGYDWNWACRLLEPLDTIPPKFVDVDQVVKSACDGHVGAMIVSYHHLSDAPRGHRAGADTERMAIAIQKGMAML